MNGFCSKGGLKVDLNGFCEDSNAVLRLDANVNGKISLLDGLPSFDGLGCVKFRVLNKYNEFLLSSYSNKSDVEISKECALGSVTLFINRKGLKLYS
jgi:hypothetical protein